MSDVEKLRGKVASILTDRELALNIGSDDGVRRGMRFAVLEGGTREIKDPDTGESLGAIDVPKVFVKIIRVHEKFSVAATYRTRRENIGGPEGNSLSVVSQMFQPPKYVERTETLRTDDRESGAPIEDYESYVREGDVVVQVLEGEYANS